MRLAPRVITYENSNCRKKAGAPSYTFDDFGQYNDALFVALINGVGSSAFVIHRAGAGITKTHLAGLQSATDAISVTGNGNALTITASSNITLSMLMATAV